MAKTNPWWRSRHLWTTLSFMVALSTLILVIIGLTPTETCLDKDICYGLYRGKPVPAGVEHPSPGPAMTELAAEQEATPRHLARRDAINITNGDIPNIESKDEPTQREEHVLGDENTPETTERWQEDQRAQGNDYDQNKDQAQDEEIQDYAENEGDTDTDSLAPLEPACLVNGDCSSGYKCAGGYCEPGCDKHQDCPPGYRCRYGRWGYRCFAMKGRHQECLEHLRFCMQDFQCCSGYCGQRKKGKAYLCWPKRYNFDNNH